MIIYKMPVPLDDHLQPHPRKGKGNEKCIFETLYNEIKCVLSVKESNLNKKKDQNFHICLRSGPTGLTCKHWLFSEFTHAVKAQDLCYYMVLPRTCHKGALQKLHSRFCPLRGYLKFSLAELVGTPLPPLTENHSAKKA